MDNTDTAAVMEKVSNVYVALQHLTIAFLVMAYECDGDASNESCRVILKQRVAKFSETSEALGSECQRFI